MEFLFLSLKKQGFFLKISQMVKRFEVGLAYKLSLLQIF
jgi:hypothetical protein